MSSSFWNITSCSPLKVKIVGFVLVSCLAFSSVDFQWTTQHYIPEERTLHNHRCENLKSYRDGSKRRILMKICNLLNWKKYSDSHYVLNILCACIKNCFRSLYENKVGCFNLEQERWFGIWFIHVTIAKIYWVQ
jgi:hypothetical protein